MSEELYAIMAGNMFTKLFGASRAEPYLDQLKEVQQLIEATLSLKAVPVNRSSVAFTHALCELESLPIAEKRRALEALGTRITAELSEVVSA